jgi:hypothetical protein
MAYEERCCDRAGSTGAREPESSIGAFSQFAMAVAEMTFFGECGLIVPAVGRRLSATISQANSFACSSVLNVRVLRAYFRDPSSGLTV